MAKIKLKTSEMRSTFAALDRLATMKFPTKGSYSISRALAKMQGDFETSEKARNKLIEEYGQKREDGAIHVLQEAPEGATKEAAEEVVANFKAFEAAHQELMDTEIEIDVPYIVLGNLGDVEVEPALLFGIDKLLVEELPA